MTASQNLLGSHDTPRFLTIAEEDPRRLALAIFTQMTIPGAPGLYYGDEVGMTGGEAGVDFERIMSYSRVALGALACGVARAA